MMIALLLIGIANLLAIGMLTAVVVRAKTPAIDVAAQPPALVDISERSMPALREQHTEHHAEHHAERDDYFVAHEQRGVQTILYEGHNANRAYDAHRKMELDPPSYPGRHIYRKNGQTIVDRLHSEITHA